MAKIWTTPWAATGDKNVIPDAAQPDGSVSNTTGWGFDYQREYVDPLAKDIVRADMNGVLNSITDGLGEVQKQGAPNWSVDAAPYPINAVVYHINKRWTSSIANNSNTPGDISNTWIDYSTQDPTTTIRGIPLLATDVQADAGTNDTAMLSSAKGLRLIRSAISQATESLLGTLRIGTQSEVNIGSLNTVAVTPLKLKEFVKTLFGGSTQTLQNVTASRAVSTIYTNNTGRPIVVYVTGTSSGAGVDSFLNLRVSNVDVSVSRTSFGGGVGVNAVVPVGEPYSVTVMNISSITSWREYR